MNRSKKKDKAEANKNIITSFKAYKKKYFPKQYAEEESHKIQPLRFKS